MPRSRRAAKNRGQIQEVVWRETDWFSYWFSFRL